MISLPVVEGLLTRYIVTEEVRLEALYSYQSVVLTRTAIRKSHNDVADMFIRSRVIEPAYYYILHLQI